MPWIRRVVTDRESDDLGDPSAALRHPVADERTSVKFSTVF